MCTFIAQLRILMVTAGLARNVIIFTAITALNRTLRPFPAQLQLLLSASSVGLILGLTMLSIIFSIMSDPIAGFASALTVLVGGLCVVVRSLLLVGPPPLQYCVILMLLQQSLPLILCSLIGVRADISLTTAPSASLVVRAAISEGLTVQIASDQLATLTMLAFTLGGLVGPIPAGFIFQWLGGPKLGFQLLRPHPWLLPSFDFLQRVAPRARLRFPIRTAHQPMPTRLKWQLHLTQIWTAPSLPHCSARSLRKSSSQTERSICLGRDVLFQHMCFCHGRYSFWMGILFRLRPGLPQVSRGSRWKRRQPEQNFVSRSVCR